MKTTNVKLKEAASELKAAALALHEAVYDQKRHEEILKLWADVKFWTDSVRAHLLENDEEDV